MTVGALANWRIRPGPDERKGTVMSTAAELAPQSARRSQVPGVRALRLVSPHSDTPPPAAADGRRNLPLTGEEPASLAFCFPSGVPLHAQCARTWLRTLLAQVWEEDSAYRVALAAHEVIANGAVHGAGVVRVSVAVTPCELLIDVCDDSPALPQRRATEAGAESGRGLDIVERLGGELEVCQLGIGKLVRLRISRHASDLDAAAWTVGVDV